MSYKMKLLKSLQKSIAKEAKIKVSKPTKPKVVEIVKGKPKLRLPGLQEYDVAMSSKSECFICSENIMIDTMRFSYRFKASSSLRHERRCHHTCIAGIPRDTHTVDMALLNSWLTSDVSPAVADMLRTAWNRLRLVGPG